MIIGNPISPYRTIAGGFSPSDVANLAVRLRAGKGVTTVGGAVSQWDLETPFRGVSNVAQATGAQQPSHIVSDPAYNGKSTISFDGGDNLDGGNWSSPLAQPSTYFFVGETGGSGAMAFLDRAGGAGRNLIGTSSANKYQIFAGNSLLSGGNTDADIHVHEAIFNGASAEFLLDGVSIISGDVGAQASDSLRVGDNIVLTGGMTGKLAEILIYDALVSASDRALIRAFLSNFYGI